MRNLESVCDDIAHARDDYLKYGPRLAANQVELVDDQQ